MCLEWHSSACCGIVRTVTTYRIWLQTERKNSRSAGLLKLGNGVPCGDTILRVVESVNPAQLRASLDCRRGHIIESLCGNQVIIDGKKLRGENPRSPGCHGLYILNAWVSENRNLRCRKAGGWQDQRTYGSAVRIVLFMALQGHWFQSTQWGPTVISQNRSCSRAATI